MRRDLSDGPIGCIGLALFLVVWLIGIALTLAFWAAVFAILADAFNIIDVVNFV